MNETTLKPCPFCGGTDLMKYHIYQAVDACSACIECEFCGASGRKYDVKVDQDGMLEDFDEYKQRLIDEWNFRPRDEIHAADPVLKKLAEAEQGAKQAYLKLRESGVLASDWEDDDERKSHYFMLYNGAEDTARMLLQQIKTLVGIV